MKFENAFKKLEEIILNFENQNISLSESLKLYEQGIELLRFCQNELSEAENKIFILNQNKEKKEGKTSDRTDKNNELSSENSSHQKKDMSKKETKKLKSSKLDNSDLKKETENKILKDFDLFF